MRVVSTVTKIKVLISQERIRKDSIKITTVVIPFITSNVETIEVGIGRNFQNVKRQDEPFGIFTIVGKNKGSQDIT